MGAAAAADAGEAPAAAGAAAQEEHAAHLVGEARKELDEKEIDRRHGGKSAETTREIVQRAAVARIIAQGADKPATK